MRPTLSMRQLVRLANNDELSLCVRLYWQKMRGHDPYNDIRRIVRAANLWWAIFCSFMLDEILVMLLDSSLLKGNNEYLVPKVVNATTLMYFLSMCAVSVTLFVVTKKDYRNSRDRAKEFQRRFPKLLIACFSGNETLMQAASKIAMMDLASLRELAREVLIRAALDVLYHSNAHPGEHNSTWHIDHAKLVDTFNTKYRIFESFYLAYGGYNYFYNEARKLIAKSAPATVEHAPTSVA